MIEPVLGEFGACGGGGAGDVITYNSMCHILKNRSSTNNTFTGTNKLDYFGDVLHWVGGKLHGDPHLQSWPLESACVQHEVIAQDCLRS